MGLKPNNGTFNTMLQCLFRSNIIPDSQTYGTLLDGLCKNRHIPKALSLFHMMESNGLDLNVVMYNILIDTFCKDKKLDTTRALFNDLSFKGLHPNVKTYNMMIQGLCEEILLHEAKELKLMTRAKGHVSVITKVASARELSLPATDALDHHAATEFKQSKKRSIEAIYQE
ncbi:hypothetical protein HYC85_019430 [Camellia sinensis]|uniref:Pentacotripeptide-repeat region of PRORP domain-containing protein n=1 Tax=Camellia sinensis TaxID=4442 RepID=A0A7J7GQU3_CAMSI|nr:hypothetical protein HYC85_019430 [Camellia sinensis]